MKRAAIFLIGNPLLWAQSGPKTTTIKVPQGLEHFALVKDCYSAHWMAEASAGDREWASTKPSEKYIKYSAGALVLILGKDGECSEVRLGNGASGWVLTRFLDRTPREIRESEEIESARRIKADQADREELRRKSEEDDAIARAVIERKTHDALLASAKKKARAEAEARRLAEIAREKNAKEDRQAFLSTLPTIVNGYTSIFIGADPKCEQQFVQAMSMEGIEKRIRMADLISYQCGFIEKQGTHAQRLRNAGQFCEVMPIDGEHKNKTGWVDCAWLKYPTANPGSTPR